MKKFVWIVAVLLLVGSVAAFSPMAWAQTEHPAAKSEICPTCNVEIPTGEKPVLSMLAGTKHTCPSCGSSYDVAANQEVHSCSACGGQVHTCTLCGKTELIPKA